MIQFVERLTGQLVAGLNFSRNTALCCSAWPGFGTSLQKNEHISPRSHTKKQEKYSSNINPGLYIQKKTVNVIELTYAFIQSPQESSLESHHHPCSRLNGLFWLAMV